MIVVYNTNLVSDPPQGWADLLKPRFRDKLENISKDFGKTAAVHNFTVTVADGEFITFLGPSGCGKTTSRRLVAGFIEPTGGAVIIGDRPVSDPGRGIFVPPEDRKVGMVFQSYAVWPHMKVFDNVAYPLKIKRVPRKEMARRVEETPALVKMPELLDRYPHELSGGQQQRVALATALMAGQAERLGLALSLHGASYDINWGSINPGIRRESLYQVEESITAAARIGAEVVVLHPGRLSASKANLEEYWQVMEENFVLINEPARGEGIKAGIETMEKRAKEMYILPRDVRRMLDKGWSNLGLTLDLAHANTVMDPAKNPQP